MSVTPQPKKKNYLNNKDLLAEVIKSKEQGKMTDKLAKMLQMLTARYGKRSNYAGYTYNEDMQAFAMMSLAKTWSAFNPERSSNPFAFFTQCIKNSFNQYLNSERKQRDIRDELLIKGGLAPSNTYQVEYEAKYHHKWEIDHHDQHVIEIEEPEPVARPAEDDDLISC